MMLEKNIKNVVEIIEKYYKNMELASYVINNEEKCIDIALYDDIGKSNTLNRYFASKHFHSTEIKVPNITNQQLEEIKNRLESVGIIENELFEPTLNKTIYNIGDVIIYENCSHGKIIDINRADTDFPYAIVFPDIFIEDRPYWVADDEIEMIVDENVINEINTWYESEKEQIQRDIEELNCE